LCETDRKWVLQRGFYPEDRAIVVEPGLDAPYLAVPFIPAREERVAFTGSWISRKGITILISVMSQLMQSRPSLSLDIYGSAGAQETVQAAFPASVRSRVIVHPRLTETEIASGLSRAKIFFFPTQYEGFGIALAEAMACGCAAVTTRTGFGAELRDGEEAILCGFNDEAAMQNAINELLDKDDLRCRIAHGGWERTRSLTWEANVSKLEKAYSSWVSHHDNR
jgi:glycosyltransferase involved in cell wall biosynthesis